MQNNHQSSITRKVSTNHPQKKDEKVQSVVKGKMAASGNISERSTEQQMQQVSDDVFNEASSSNKKQTIYNEKQSEKRKRISTGDSSLDIVDEHKHLTSNERFSLILSKLSDNEHLIKSFEEKLDSAVDQARISALDKHIEEHDSRITVLEYKYIDLEARSRRKNLIFREFQEQRDECCANLISQFIKSQMNVNDELAIGRVHRLGKYKQGTNRPIIVAFRDYQAIELIMSSARSLADTYYGVSRDFPQEITHARKQLWPEYKELKSRNPNGKVRIIFPAKLVMYGKVIKDMFPNWNEYVNTSRVYSHTMYTHRSENSYQNTTTTVASSHEPNDPSEGKQTPTSSQTLSRDTESSQRPSSFRPWGIDNINPSAEVDHNSDDSG